MKTCALAVALCAFFASAVGAVELVIEPDTLTPTSTVELRFESPMVGKDRVGSVEQNSPLVASPGITGEFKWTSSRSGQFRFTQPPTFATTYKFSLRQELKDLEGNAVTGDELGEYATEGLKVADEWRAYPYYSGDSAQRTPFFLLQFNDRVNPAEVARQAYFVSKSSQARIPATARLATGKDFKKQYHTELVQTWDEQIAGTKPKVELTETRPNALVIQTANPLPIGKEWVLMLPGTVTNTAGNATLGEDDTRQWGNILPLAIKRLVATPHFDEPHAIEINFNKQIAAAEIKPADAGQKIAPYIKVEPPVGGMKIVASYNSVTIAGDFTLHQPYTVTLMAGFPGADGLPLATTSRDTVTFTPGNVFVSTTAIANTQLSTGKGLFDLYAANFKDLRIRVKQLSDGELIKARTLYQDTYDPHASDTNKAAQKIKDNPFDAFPGTVIYDKTLKNQQALQKSTYMELSWKEILGQRPAAPVFIEIEATAQDQAPGGTIINRSIVEFTDIGLLVKTNEQDALVYAFSLRTGLPMPGVQLTLADSRQGLLQTGQTDASGFAKIPAKGAVWALAKKGEETTALNFGEQGDRIGLWGQGINVAWESPFKDRFETFLFSDRPVYKPGDTAHVKALTRHRNGDVLSLGAQPATATMTVTDDRNRTILTKPVTFTANGTWADDITFPDDRAGWYSLRLEFPPLDGVKKPDSDDSDAQVANLELRVD
ncbi:MAG: MG2 domain-containing protein, partial [Verrucomicrobium sp.]